MSELTQKKLKEQLHYNPQTGMFTRIKKPHKNKNRMVGCLDRDGYISIGVLNNRYTAHRLAWLYMKGYFPKNMEIDHINRCRADNIFKNLRIVSTQCNQRNTGNRVNNKSGVKGVSWHKKAKKWHAQIAVHPNKFFLGIYNEFHNAVCARLIAEQCFGWAGCDSSSPAYKYVQKMLGNHQTK